MNELPDTQCVRCGPALIGSGRTAAQTLASASMSGLTGFLLFLAPIALLFGAAWLVARFRTAQSRVAPPVGPLPVPPDVQAEIEALADVETADAAAESLVARGRDVVPHLLCALPATHERVWVRERLLAVIGRIGDPRAQATLEEMVLRGVPCWGAALAQLVSFGDADAARVALEVLDGYEASHTGRSPPLPSHHVYEGIALAAKHGRVMPAFREALLLPVLRRIGERWPEVRPNAADAALALDPEAAGQVLISPEVLGRGADAVAAALAAFVDAGRNVAPDLAMSLATSLPVRAPRTPSEYFTLHSVLTALARSGHPRAEETIRSFEGVADETTQEVVRAALETLGSGPREAPGPAGPDAVASR